MTPSFLTAIGYVLANEGGHANNPADHGGDTWMGISHRAFPYESPWPPSYERTLELYFEHYWQPIHGDLLTSLRVATKLLDTAIWTGVWTAGILLQRALHSLGQAVVIDGDVGPQTRTAIDALSVQPVLNAYCEAIVERIRGLVAADASQHVFLAGWQSRAERLPV